MTFYKEWLDKIAEEAAQDYAIPMVACRFSNARQGVEKFVAMDLNVFMDLMNLISTLQEALDEEYKGEEE